MPSSRKTLSGEALLLVMTIALLAAVAGETVAFVLNSWVAMFAALGLILLLAPTLVAVIMRMLSDGDSPEHPAA